MPSVIIKSESTSKPDQEIVNNHKTDTQNHLSGQDDTKTFVAYFNHLHNCLRRALTTWCREMPRNLIVHPAYNNSLSIIVIEYCHLYICLLQLHFLCFNLSYFFLFSFNMLECICLLSKIGNAKEGLGI